MSSRSCTNVAFGRRGAGGGPPEVSVVVPTLNERENLRPLCERLARALNGQPWSSELVIVDDDSPDGTYDEAQRLAAQYPLRAIRRQGKRSLSLAVLEGFACARGRTLVVMDADLSHPPEALPRLVVALEHGVEFVIGSRYTPGGHTEEAWSRWRRWNSKVATLLAWPLSRLHDPMAGFFALRRDLLQHADPLDPVGYKIGLELLVKCHVRRACEVPIVFAERQRGRSKLTWKEQLRYVEHLRRLYLYRWVGRPLRHLRRPWTRTASTQEGSWSPLPSRDTRVTTDRGVVTAPARPRHST